MRILCLESLMLQECVKGQVYNFYGFAQVICLISLGLPQSVIACSKPMGWQIWVS